MLAVDLAAWSSPWRLRHPADVLTLAGGLLACAVLLPPWPAAPLVLATVAVLALGPAGVPARLLGRAVRAPLAFIGLAGLSVAVTLDPAGGAPVAVTGEGLAQAAAVAARALAGTSAVLLLAATTPLAELLPRLRALGVPAPVVEVASLVYRMLFLLLDSVRTLREAQAARLGYRDVRTSFRSAGQLGAAVLVRSLDRARRLEVGLATRGFDGDLPVLPAQRRPSAAFVGASVAGCMALAAVTLVLAAVAGGGA